MGKLTNLLSAVGLVPGRKADRNAMRFGKIVVATDADPDGGDIFTLLINLFYQFWPELFDPDYEPIIYRLVAPMYVRLKVSREFTLQRKNITIR
jgi:DNA gyrase/topoisomerase IV subunit B